MGFKPSSFSDFSWSTGLLTSGSTSSTAVSIDSGRVCRAGLRLGFGNGRLVFGSHIAALHTQHAGAIDADEGASPCDFLGVILDRPIVERGKCRLDFAKPLVDLFGEFLGIRMGLLELLILRPQRLGRGHLLVAHRDRLAGDVAQSVGVAVGKVGRDLYPFPAFGPNDIGFALELFGNKPIEQHGILQPAAIVLLEQVPHDGATDSLVGLDPNELRALVGGANRPFGQEPADMSTAPWCRSAASASHTCS